MGANPQAQSPSDYFQGLVAAGRQGTTTQGYAQPTSPEPSSNLPFDSRIYRRNKIIDQNIQVGSMRTVETPFYSCFFLFNPNEIDKAYSFDSSIPLPPEDQSSSTAAEGAGTVLNQTISFTLLFDRTFEVWTGVNGGNVTVGDYSGPGPYKFGAQWDIWAVERLLGIYGQAQYPNSPSGPPLARICQVTFSDAGNPQSQAAVASSGVNNQGKVPSGGGGHVIRSDPSDSIVTGAGALTFQGWMQNLDVQYTRFDANMTPTRAAVSVGFQVVYSLPGFLPASDPTSSPGSNAAGTGSNQSSTGGPNVPNAQGGIGSAPYGPSGTAPNAQGGVGYAPYGP